MCIHQNQQGVSSEPIGQFRESMRGRQAKLLLFVALL